MPTKAEIIHMLMRWLERAHLRDGALLSLWMFLTASENKRGGHLEINAPHKSGIPIEIDFSTRPQFALAAS